jgi:hypothetical protein
VIQLRHLSNKRIYAEHSRRFNANSEDGFVQGCESPSILLIRPSRT